MDHFETRPPVPYRVARGVMLLDRHVPEWYNRVNLATLDIYSYCDCILAQVLGDGSYTNGRAALTKLNGDYDAIGCGFDGSVTDAKAITDEWKRIIRERRTANEPLAPWERELLGMTGSTVTFTLTDGRTLSFENVKVDSVGPSAESPGVVGVEFADDADRVVHVPFVSHWEFTH